MRGKLTRLTDKLIEFMSGDTLLYHGFDRQLGFVFFIFLLVSAKIAWSLNVEKDLAQVEKNEAIIEDLRINWQQRSLDMIGMDNRDEVEYLLRKNNSTLKAPATPPEYIFMEGSK